VIKSKFLTFVFQKFLKNKDIRIFRNSLVYYFIFRIIRNFLAFDIIIKIYDFKVFGSIQKNKTSYFLLKKCEFGDYHELNTIKKFSKKNKILFIDCGCNYGFYSFYVASLSKENKVISVEASKKTSSDFLKNLNLNNFLNIDFQNKAISNIESSNILFNESNNDWESSQTHSDFKLASTINIDAVKIDGLTKFYNFNNYKTIIKLDIEGNEMNAIKGGLKFIEETSPLIIIEFSKFIFDKESNIKYLKNFLINYEYSIYDTNSQIFYLEDVLNKLMKLDKKYKTIGNYYLIKNFSKNLEDFLSNE
jgi:FkbM family methyltransferase